MGTNHAKGIQYEDEEIRGAIICRQKMLASIMMVMKMVTIMMMITMIGSKIWWAIMRTNRGSTSPYRLPIYTLAWALFEGQKGGL